MASEVYSEMRDMDRAEAEAIAEREGVSVATSVGRRVGLAIYHDVIAEPDMSREWTGLSAEDGDQLTLAGLLPDTPEWDEAERMARETYEAAIREEKGNQCN